MITGTYSISYQATGGNGPTSFSLPSLNDNDGYANAGTSVTYQSLNNYKGNISQNVTLGTQTNKLDFFTINPNNSSGCPGSGCIASVESGHTYYTASGNLTVTFTSFTINGDLAQITGGTTSDTGLYQAKYGGAPINPCALASAGSGSGNKTDCIAWNQSGNPDDLVISLKDTITNLTYTLDIQPFDAEDWSITPTIEFKLSQSTTPLPGALPLFVNGSGLLGFLGWRRQKRSAKAA